MSFSRSRLPGTPFPAEPIPAIAVCCPFCASRDIGAAGKTITEASYWRCQACGEVWNPSRAPVIRNPGGRRW